MKKLLILLIPCFILLTGCTQSYQSYDFDYFYFDTSINIKVNYTNKDDFDFEQMNKDLEGILKKLQNEFDPTHKGGELNTLNTTNEIDASEDFLNVLNKSLEVCNLTEGHYDPTSGTLINLWSININNYLPTKEEIKKAQQAIGCDKVVVNDKHVSKPEGYLLDFGSIVKGYSADLIDEYLKENGVYSAIINLGGNIQTVGTKENEEPFVIGISRPEVDNITNENVITIDSVDQAVVTSGINQRYFIKDDKIYHHIIDAVKGYPVDNNLASVSIITDKGINADVLSTTVFIMGLDKGYEYVQSLDGVEAVFVTRDKKIYMTSSDLNYELNDSTYTIVEK